jgi:hypothetical protein
MTGSRLHRRLAWVVIAAVCVSFVVVWGGGGAGNQTVHTVAGPVNRAPGTADALESPSSAVTAADGSADPGSTDAPSSTPSGRTRGSTGRSSTTAGKPGAVAITQPTGSGVANGPVRGPLHTDGNVIMAADGPVLLRGVNRIGMQEMGSAPPITAAELDHAREWGINIIRVLTTDAYSNPQCPSQIQPGYFDAMDAIVSGITSRGMVALLDLTTVTRTPCGQLARWRMADSPGAITYWTTVATRYKDNPLVAFDLYNEPNNITNEQWRNGGVLVDPAVTGQVQWAAAGMQQLLDAVRSTGATNLVTVSGNGWAADPSPIVTQGGLQGTNVVYAAHDYTCSHVNEPLCLANPANKQQDLTPLWSDVAQQYPVIISEFGWPDPHDGSFNASVIHFAESHTPKWGWIAFAWNGTKDNNFILLHDLSTYAPSESGAPVKAAMTGG